MTKQLQDLKNRFPNLLFQENVLLAPFTFMKVGGRAELFVQVDSQNDLFGLSSFCFTQHIPFVVLGGVSNSVIPDQGLDKLVIRNKTDQIFFQESPNEKVRVIADSGVITAVLAKETVKLELTGLEPFVGVPGTIGGAVVNNSHFNADDLIGNYIVSLTICTSNGKKEVWEKDKLEFGYDTSIFHHDKAIILSVTFMLEKGNKDLIKERVLAAAAKRAMTQPLGIPSTGCMFRNPKITSDQATGLRAQFQMPDAAIKEIDGQIQIAAGYLIDKAGLKGLSVGGAEVSEKHATYVVNTGTATAHDVDLLARQVEQKVFEKFGIKLEREVFFL